MEFNNFGKTQVKKAVKITTEKSIEFGKEEKKCYRAQVILVNGNPYFGVSKCWKDHKTGKYKPSKQSFYLSQPAWVRFIEEVLPQLTYNPNQVAGVVKGQEEEEQKHGVKRQHDQLHDDEQHNTDGRSTCTSTIATSQLGTGDTSEPDSKIANWE